MREGMTAAEWLERFQSISQLKLGRYAKDPKENLEACFDICRDRFSDNDRSLYKLTGNLPLQHSDTLGGDLSFWHKLDRRISDFDCEELMIELARQGLLEIQSNKLVAWHDLLHDYQRGKHQALAVMHETFLAAYDPGSSGWFSIENDGYIYRHLAYHLSQAGRNDVLQELLSDYRWLQIKLDSTDVAALIADYAFVTGNAAIHQIEHALRLSSHVLAHDPTQLASQLMGRLQSQATLGIQTLLKTAREFKTGTWLCPLSPSLSQPGGSLFFTLPGHPGVKAITILSGDRKAISGSSNGTFIEWDLDVGTEIRRITLEPHLWHIAIASDGRRAISAPASFLLREREESKFKVWDLASGEHAREVAVAVERVEGLTISLDGRRAAVSTESKLQVWSIEQAPAGT